MTKNDVTFLPHSDMHPNDMETMTQHKNLIQQNHFSAASKLLDTVGYEKGFRADMFNHLCKKIQDIQIYLLNKYVAEPDELYSAEVPTREQMTNKKYWIQPY